MPFYIPNLVPKTTCIGNTLSTFNISFSNLDTKLQELSVYTVNSVNFLSSTMISVSSTLNTRINFLSSSMISASANLRTQIASTSADLKTQIFNTSSFLGTQTDYLSTQINFVSANVVDEYQDQGILYVPTGGGTVNWNFETVGVNAKLVLTANAILANPTALRAGQTGNLVVQIGSAAGPTITGYGDRWLFSGSFSSLNTSASARNVISYYYDGDKLLSNVLSF